MRAESPSLTTSGPTDDVREREHAVTTVIREDQVELTGLLYESSRRSTHDLSSGAGRGERSTPSGRSTLAGRNIAAARPMSPTTIRATIPSASERLPVARIDTRIVPAIAVPKDEPRLDTLRDRPEISPCSSSGKLDCTTFTEGVSMIPRPEPTRNSPGTKARMLSVALKRPSKSAMPATVVTKPTTIKVFCVRRLANRSAPKDVSRTPSVAAVKMTPVSIALYPRTVWR